MTPSNGSRLKNLPISGSYQRARFRWPWFLLLWRRPSEPFARGEELEQRAAAKREAVAALVEREELEALIRERRFRGELVDQERAELGADGGGVLEEGRARRSKCTEQVYLVPERRQVGS